MNTNIKRITFFILLLLLLHLPANSGMEVGAGARALALANNHVASANNLSALYWNPAALAILPVREFQVSFDGMRMYGTTEVAGTGVTVPSGAKMSDYSDRIRLSGLGYMSAMPTVQGGLTLAASFDRPYMFDNFTFYTFNTPWDETVELDGRRYGDLNRWSGAFGIQVAPKVSAGLTLSVVSGSYESPIKQKVWFDNTLLEAYPDYYDVEFEKNFLGYMLTFGALAYPTDELKIGLKIDAVSNIRFTETWFLRENYADTRRERGDLKGRAYRAPTGTLGIEYKLPWITTAFDIRATMPYTFVLPLGVPDTIQARYFKFGAGIGLEAPLPSLPIVLRAGYSIDEHDIYPIIYKYDGLEIEWGDANFWPKKDRHTIGAGIAFFTAGLGLELSYAYQTWGIATNNWDNWMSLRQNYSSHRVMTSIIYRY